MFNLQMRAYFGQLDGFDKGSQWAGQVEEFNKKAQWTIVFSLTQVEGFSQIWVQEVQDLEYNCFFLRQVEEFSPARDVPVSVFQQERFPRK